ncbi:hypothetical protein ACQKGI_10515 [Peribacillus muralis]|uniref:hypothetical protein n=1 Tax=Peribacillus muralis TaxID=264697 RepID=UPI00380A2E74
MFVFLSLMELKTIGHLASFSCREKWPIFNILAMLILLRKGNILSSSEYDVKKELIHMNCTNRTQKKILAYSALFKKIGIINEEEYKAIAKTFQAKD